MQKIHSWEGSEKIQNPTVLKEKNEKGKNLVVRKDSLLKRMIKMIKRIRMGFLKFILKITFLSGKSLPFEKQYQRLAMLTVNIFCLGLATFNSVNFFTSMDINDLDVPRLILYSASTVAFYVTFFFYFLTCGRFFSLYMFLTTSIVICTYVCWFFILHSGDAHYCHDTITYIGICLIINIWIKQPFLELLSGSVFVALILFVAIKEIFVIRTYDGFYDPSTSYFTRFANGIKEVICPIISISTSAFFLFYFVHFKDTNEKTLFKLVSAIVHLDLSSPIIKDILEKQTFQLTEMEKLFKVLIRSFSYFSTYLPEEVIAATNAENYSSIGSTQRGGDDGSDLFSETTSIRSDDFSDTETVNTVNSVNSNNGNVATYNIKYQKNKNKANFYKLMDNLHSERSKGVDSFEKKRASVILVSFSPSLDDIELLFFEFLRMNHSNLPKISNQANPQKNELANNISLFFSMLIKSISNIVKDNNGITHSFNNSDMVIGFNTSKRCVNHSTNACIVAKSIKDEFLSLKSKLFTITTKLIPHEMKSIVQKFFMDNFRVNIAIVNDEFEIGSLGLKYFQVFGKGMKFLKAMNDKNQKNYRQIFSNQILICEDVHDLTKFDFESQIIDEIRIVYEETESKKKEESIKKSIYFLRTNKKTKTPSGKHNSEWFYELANNSPTSLGLSEGKEMEYMQLFNEILEKEKESPNDWSNIENSAKRVLKIYKNDKNYSLPSKYLFQKFQKKQPFTPIVLNFDLRRYSQI